MRYADALRRSGRPGRVLNQGEVVGRARLAGVAAAARVSNSSTNRYRTDGRRLRRTASRLHAALDSKQSSGEPSDAEQLPPRQADNCCGAEGLAGVGGVGHIVRGSWLWTASRSAVGQSHSHTTTRDEESRSIAEIARRLGCGRPARCRLGLRARRLQSTDRPRWRNDSDRSSGPRRPENWRLGVAGHLGNGRISTTTHLRTDTPFFDLADAEVADSRCTERLRLRPLRPSPECRRSVCLSV